MVCIIAKSIDSRLHKERFKSTIIIQRFDLRDVVSASDTWRTHTYMYFDQRFG